MDISNKEKWKSIWDIILEPINFLSIIAIIFLIWYSVFNPHQEDAFLSVMLNIFISVLVGIMGSRIKDKLDENKILSKGKSAIRNLELLASNINDFKDDILGYCKNKSIKDNEDEFAKNSFEEVSKKLDVLKKITINSAEDWSDLIPDADIQSQIEAFGDSQRRMKKLETEINKLKKISKAGKDENKKLKEDIELKEDELEETKSELREKSVNLSPFMGRELMNSYSINDGEFIVRKESDLYSFSHDHEVIGKPESVTQAAVQKIINNK